MNLTKKYRWGLKLFLFRLLTELGNLSDFDDYNTETFPSSGQPNSRNVQITLFLISGPSIL